MSDLPNDPATEAVVFDPFAGPAIQRAVDSTEAQREIWSASQMGRDASLAYNEAVLIRLRGPLDVVALRGALNMLVARHESLRATFSADGRKLMIGDVLELEMPVTDVSSAPSERNARLARVVTTEFSLEQGPLVRAELLQLSPDVHELLFSAHHIVCDGWSFGVIASELAALYSARRAGAVAALDAPPSFTAYAHETGESARGAERADDERFWLQQFTGPIPVLDLPGDRGRPPLKTFAAGREDRVVPKGLMRDVRWAGMKAGNSMFATLFAGFAALVHRLSGQDDLVIGVPSAGQSASGHAGLVGHCVNMLPIRVRPSPSHPFDAFAAEVRTASLDAFDHQRLGFGSLLERLALPRDPSRIPLVSVLFNVDRSLPASAMPFDGLQAELESIPRAYENFDLFLNAVETEDGLALECQYNSDLFDAATIRRWLESYERLLAGVAANVGTPIARLPVLTDEDRTALDACNDTILELPAERVVHRMIEAQVARTPDAIAVECDGVRVSYAELNRRANRLAHHLRACGACSGALVGLCLERTSDLLVALAAVLKSGAGYVPLDPNYPADRLAYMAQDAQLAVIITDARIADESPLPATAIVRVDTDAAVVAACPDTNLPDDAGSAAPEDTAYVIYTSGSTGKPKGVLVPHRSVVNLLASVQREPGVRADDTVLAITTLSFDIAVSEVILPLTVGARIILASRDVASDGALLMQLVESSGVTFIDATPATYRLLLASGWRGNRSLRVICTGEAMPRDLAETLVTCAAEVWNGYGPTETTVWSTFARVTAPVTRVLIGRPVANTIVRILDAAGEQVPIGVPGELFIAGLGVTKGYLNRPDLTAERFIADPAAPGMLMYRTGDLVRMLPSGELECLGRNDNQVKVRGYRIEPGEIEAVIMKWPGVRNAVVVAREDRVNDVRLVAYLVTDSGDVQADGLRAFVKEALPEYMVPYTFVQLPALPLTPSGKVDRKALPAPQAAVVATTAEEFVAPATPSEEMIAALWAEVLGMGRVSVVADFFALGGHSLLASQVLSRLRRDHGIQLSFRKIFEAPTVRTLAALVDAARSSDAPGAVAAGRDAIVSRDDQSSAPLTVLQQRLWSLEDLEPTQRSAHAHSASWRLRGMLDHARLDRAYAALFARHATLRTSFETRDGDRRQVVAATAGFRPERRDLSHLDTSAQAAALEEYFREQQHLPFDLAVAPLYRACIFTLGTDEYLLYSLQHGMVWDGWSFDLFLTELCELYSADEQGRAPQLGALSVTYGDFAAWQAEWLAGPEAEAQRRWWGTQLAGELQELTLPTDFPRPALSTNAGNQISLPFSLDEAEQLRTLARSYDVTLFMIAFAAYNVILHHYTGQDDILIGSPVRARTRPELEGVIGPFVNTVLLRTRVTPDLTFPQLLRSVRDVTLDAFSNQDLPFELLGTRVPAVRALFSMQDARERPAALGSLSVEQYHVPQYFTTNDLMVWMMDSRSKLYAVLNYSSELFERSTAEVMLGQLRNFLLAVLENPERRIGSIPIGGTVEPRKPSAPRLVDEEHGSAVAAIVRVAGRSPDRIAVRVGSARTTYGDLLVRARALAGGLRSAGVTAGARVALALPSGIDQVVAVLATLIAGGGVVLLDPAESDAYLAAVLGAVRATVLVTDEDTDLAANVPVRTVQQLLALEQTAEPTLRDGASEASVVCVARAGGDFEVLSETTDSCDTQTRALATALGLHETDIAMSTAEAGTPGVILELIAPLSVGATLVLASDDAREDAAELADDLDDTGTTLVFAHAGIWKKLLGTPWRAAPGLRGVMVLGAMPARADAMAFATRVPAAYMMLAMPIEGGAIAVAPVRASDGAVHVAAETLAGTPLAVVDTAGVECPPGVPGAVVLRDAGSVALSLGLRARRVADGRIQLLAADPGMIWCGSIPVAPEAIADAVRAARSVADAAIAVHADASGVPRVVAYAVARDGARIHETEVRTAARSRVSRRAAPQRVVELGSLPREPRGTVATALLSSPFTSGAGAGAVVEPRNDAERLLVDVWKSVLGLEEVSVLDNFFQKGGTSLLCFRVVEQVRTATGKRLNPRALLVGTLEQAADELAADPSNRGADAPAPIAAPGVLSRLKGLMS